MRIEGLMFYGLALQGEVLPRPFRRRHPRPRPRPHPVPAPSIISFLADGEQPVTAPGTQYPLGSPRTFTRLTVNLLGPLTGREAVRVTLLKNSSPTGLTVMFNAPLAGPSNMLAATLAVGFAPYDTLSGSVKVFAGGLG